ncbi:SDR family NAD(P)-dependent oxidoreductase [Streptomyces bottropensis]|uniref:SDR family NAD(P)-dependent oxidoreductase n=1 Tax=Streptomyces bottropensis TaxID=42235 RepID=UPI0036768067
MAHQVPRQRRDAPPDRDFSPTGHRTAARGAGRPGTRRGMSAASLGTRDVQARRGRQPVPRRDGTGERHILQPEPEHPAPQVVAEPAPPYDTDKQRRPGLETGMRTAPRYRAQRYRAAGKLQDKVALITGGDSGIGRAVALLYAREGADVAVVHLPDEQVDADQVRRDVEAQGRRCLLLPGDLKDPEFCREAVERTVDVLGGLNILVSNAAYLNSKLELEQLTADDFDRTFKTNIYAYFHLVMAALPHFRAGTPSSPPRRRRPSRAVPR